MIKARDNNLISEVGVAQIYIANTFYNMNRNRTLRLYLRSLSQLATGICSVRFGYDFLEVDKLSAMWVCTCMVIMFYTCLVLL